MILKVPEKWFSNSDFASGWGKRDNMGGTKTTQAHHVGLEWSAWEPEFATEQKTEKNLFESKCPPLKLIFGIST